MPEDQKMTNCNNYIGLACDPQLHHEEAKMWLEKSDAVLRDNDDGLYVSLSCQNNLNSIRNHYCMGQYEAAEKGTDLSLAQATGACIVCYASLDIRLSIPTCLTHTSSVHETYASLFSRSGGFDRAQKHVILAREGLDKIGDYAPISWISGLCAYRAACVAILQDRVQDAIEEAKEAAATGRLYKAPIGNRARSTHVLSKAMKMDPERKTEAAAARQEAQRLRRLLPAGSTVLDDENDEAFEMVNIIQG